MRAEFEYPSDVTNRQRQLIRQLLPPRKRLGRRPIHRRRIVNAILYVVRTGCQWRMLPPSFPMWSTVYGVFRQWRMDGTWRRVHDALREKTRRAAGKKLAPTVAGVDSQSVKTAEGGDERGYDTAKKITGCKRHLAVDTLGLLMAVVVHRADGQDRAASELWPAPAYRRKSGKSPSQPAPSGSGQDWRCCAGADDRPRRRTL